MCMTYADNTELEVRSWPDNKGGVGSVTLRGKHGEAFKNKLVSLTYDDVLALLKKFNGKPTDYKPLNQEEFDKREADEAIFAKAVSGISKRDLEYAGSY